ncbi:MAG: 2-oxoacid:acceptor oxidoreductase family protein [Eubacteriaceae bacterium]|jgi:2-oxoglutarate ferredoxin oxidoreductase subunit gamma|nr:2-oxoacid:acceptor oxidoreductase family protein [Eubacteriaceae bacterium]
MLTEIICAGFGGQGILTTGILISYGAFKNGKKITWYPSYGSEMRGGTANCTIKISDGEEIASPYAKELDVLLAMNAPAIDKFEDRIKPGGYLFVNASIVPDDKKYRDDIKVVKVDTVKLAEEANNPKGGNIAMIGVILKKTGLLTLEQFEASIIKYFTDKGKEKFNDANIAALRVGYNSVQ